jgi:cell division protein DivIC
MKIIFSHIPTWLRNKYTISLVSFFAIVLFFDKNDFFTRQARDKELMKLLQSKAYYQAQIATEKGELERLKSNPATVEKYAREKYLMKKENEDLFIITENHDNSNK